MADFEKVVCTPKELVKELMGFIAKEKCDIRLLNVRLMTRLSQKETRWYCDVSLEDDGENLIIKEGDKAYFYDYKILKYVKIRPFYFAACIGNKNLVFNLNE